MQTNTTDFIKKVEAAIQAREKYLSPLFLKIYGDKGVTKLTAVCLVAIEVKKTIIAEKALVIGDPLTDLLISVVSNYFIYKGHHRKQNKTARQIKMEAIYTAANIFANALIHEREISANDELVNHLTLAIENLNDDTQVSA